MRQVFPTRFFQGAWGMSLPIPQVYDQWPPRFGALCTTPRNQEPRNRGILRRRIMPSGATYMRQLARLAELTIDFVVDPWSRMASFTLLTTTESTKINHLHLIIITIRVASVRARGLASRATCTCNMWVRLI